MLAIKSDIVHVNIVSSLLVELIGRDRYEKKKMAAGKTCSRKGKAETAKVCLIYVLNVIY